MQLIESKAELLPWSPGIEGVYKTIELAGRICYRSEGKITEDSAKDFVDRMIKSNHGAMLEHGTVYLAIPYADDATLSHYRGYAGKYNEIEFTKYSKVTMMRGMYNYVTVNFRVLQENGWLYDLKYLCDPTEYHEMRYSFKLTTSIGVTRELCRHRTFSFAEQSTRYCNFSKSKFNNEVAFCLPEWIDLPEGQSYWHDGICYRAGVKEDNPFDFISIVPASFGNDEKKAQQYHYWIAALDRCEKEYMNLLRTGWQPQQAREVLPLCTASTIVVTGFASDFKHFFDLRLFGKTGNPHPNMLHLAKLMKAEAKKNGIWEDIMSYPSKFEE